MWVAGLHRDVLPIPQRLAEPSSKIKVPYSLFKGAHVDLLWDADEDIPTPGPHIDQIAHREGDVSLIVGGILRKHDIAPRLIKVAGRHWKVALSLVSEKIGCLLALVSGIFWVGFG